MTLMFLDGASGLIALAVALLAPFYIYYVIRAVWNKKHVRNRLIDLTWVVAFVLAALELGNQFL